MTLPAHIDLRAHAERMIEDGARLIEQGLAQDAVLILRQALALEPRLVRLHYHLGHALQEAGQPQQALQAYQNALSCDKAHIPTWLRLAELHRAHGRLHDAVEAYRHLLSLHPNLPEVHRDLGMLLETQGLHLEAEAAYRQALHWRPDYAEACQDLGAVLITQNRLAEAEESYRKALALQPDAALAHADLAAVLVLQDQLRQGESHYRKAIELEPDNASLLKRVGVFMHRRHQYAEAELIYRRILELMPQDKGTWNNLGILLDHQDRLPDAESAFRRALSLSPDEPDIRVGLAQTLLRQGRLAEGWPLYESRYSPKLKTDVRYPLPKLNYPQWQGESLAGKSLVIWQELGFGDMIQVMRYLSRIKALGASRIALVCKAPLKPLFETLPEVDTVIGMDKMATMADAQALAGYDCWVLAMSLPHLFATTFEDIPGAVYLQPRPERLQRWRPRLEGLAGMKIGLAWKGYFLHPNDSNRSLASLRALAPLWRVPGASFVSIQKGQAEDEASQLAEDQPLLHLGSDIADFADSAAIIAQLDLLICVDTAAAHLAGSLGVPCWVLIPAESTDWRWMLDMDTSPWYPGTMRLFRQTASGDWGGPVEQIRQALLAIGRR